ncbi:MAG: translocation/assembly module TamB domain-containing protein, partial [Halobacteriales archaeon]|nr:translocation/assembly module TamB domain-containing protein [Halobacteriales archaeon]
ASAGLSRADLEDADGTVPVDLTLRSVADRTPSEPMDLGIRTDSLPALFVLALLEDLEDVEGTISGQVDVAGTVDSPELLGTVRLVDGAWTVDAVGVRQSDVQATFDLQSDDRVLVSATGRAGGTVEVEGTVTLSPLRDPGLDLTIGLNEFRAVDRRDLLGVLSGEVQLTERFRRPVITGALSVDEGILYVEEFQRQVGIVDLSDPRFLTFMDRAAFEGRPLLAQTRNPFMDSLRVNVDLEVARNTWLRSDDMNVEIRGEMIVTYDRPNQDFVLIGELQAPRGQYQFLSRTFEVRSGSVQFVGTPGINPNLDIVASARVRRREGVPLDIIANLTGTLVEPRIELSSEEGGISESDLISYIAIGRPSNELTGFFQGGGGG